MLGKVCLFSSAGIPGLVNWRRDRRILEADDEGIDDLFALECGVEEESCLSLSFDDFIGVSGGMGRAAFSSFCV